MSGRALPLLPPCTFLHPGQVFKETRPFLAGSKERFKVKMMLKECNIQKGELSGYLASGPVDEPEQRLVTFWEGEIIDNKNFGFISADKWGASAQTDVENWATFPEFLPKLKDEVQKNGGRAVDLASYPFMFMRWKEKCFVEVVVTDDHGPKFKIMDRSSLELSEMKIDPGFYYMRFSRSDGFIKGHFSEPSNISNSFPNLSLMVTHRDQCSCRSGGKSFTCEFS